LLLLDGFKPFQTPEGDGDPVFHQRFYQAVAISLPLVILRIPRSSAGSSASGRPASNGRYGFSSR
jgi:hypothetical protein